MGAFKLTNKIDIIDGQQNTEVQLSFVSEKKKEDKNLKFLSITILLNTNTSGNNSNSFKEINMEQLYYLYIESKYTKIVKRKKIIPTICKL